MTGQMWSNEVKLNASKILFSIKARSGKGYERETTFFPLQAAKVRPYLKRNFIREHMMTEATTVLVKVAKSIRIEACVAIERTKQQLKTYDLPELCCSLSMLSCSCRRSEGDFSFTSSKIFSSRYFCCLNSFSLFFRRDS